MTRLAGRPVLAKDDLDSYVRALAQLVREIHDVPVPTLRPFSRYNVVAGLPAPSWCTDGALWQRALGVLERGVPDWSDDHLVHRDFHPLNVLLDRGAVSGLVDWIEARHGPIEADIAHCRMNLATIFDVATADAFLAACALEQPYDPRWDLVSGTDFFEPHESSHSARAFRAAGATWLTDQSLAANHHAFLAAALAQLGELP
jgi:Ser/Thr protein kinase RdoA (MazF antagonist)